MAIEYRLTLGGDIPLEQIAALAAPEATEEPALPGYPRLFSADLYDQLGYAISITNGSNGYYEADDNGAVWVWEPEIYVTIHFDISSDEKVEMGIPNTFATVARVLAARPEDAALTQDGNYLLLTRVNGVIRKSQYAAWWSDFGMDLFGDERRPGRVPGYAGATARRLPAARGSPVAAPAGRR